MAPLSRAEWLTVQEAANELGVSTKTLFRWIKSGLLTGRYVNPRLLLIRRADLHKVKRPRLGRPKKGRPDD